MLRALQIIQFFLQTGFGESKQTYGGTEDSPLFGLGMGNGAATLALMDLGTLMVNAYKRMGHGAKLTLSYMARGFLLAVMG